MRINRFRHIRRVVPYLAAYRERVFISLFLILCERILGVANPYVIRELVDLLAAFGATFDMARAGTLVALFFSFRFGADLLGGLKDYLYARVYAYVQRSVALDIFKHLLGLSIAFHTNRSTGSVSMKISRGVSALSALSFFTLEVILPTLIEIVLVSVIFTALFPPAFTIVFLVFVFAYATFTVVVTERRQKLLIAGNKKMDEGSGTSVDALLNIDAVKYFTNEDFETKRYGKTLTEWSNINIPSAKQAANLNMGQGLIIALGLGALLALAVREFAEGEATIGDFVLITAYMSSVAQPLGFLGTLYRRLKEGLADADEMFRLFDEKQSVVDRADATELKEVIGNVRLEDVHFGYTKEREVLKGVAIDVPAHARFAIVGYSGSGKSTITKLLLRFFDVTGGRVTVDGHDVRDVTQASLRRAIGVVAQDAILFNDTIRANIEYGLPGASTPDIERAARLANIHDFVMSLPDGYETLVGERGVKLSGGEKQRVAIARMIIKDPAIMVFDEATASLDSESEKIIQRAIEDISREGRTTIVIAHRLSTIQSFDTIVVMENGRVVERGSHAELLKTSTVYRKLWEIQKGEKL